MNTIQSLLKIGRMNSIKHGFLKEITKVTVLCLVMVASSSLVFFLLFSFSRGAGAQLRNSNSPERDFCKSRAEGVRCPFQDGVLRACEVGRCRDKVCTKEPAPIGTSCPDNDGTPCTIAGCTAAGTCDQRSRLRPEGSACVDGTPGCSGQTCRGGRCLPSSGEANPAQVAAVVVKDVEVEASLESERHVRQALAESDCCVVCADQVLEALVPTSSGPQRNEADGSLPLRRKFCGTITRYGVNDETKDPRDITINIRPAPVSPYPNFVAGLLNTAGTPLSGFEDIAKFGPPNNSFEFNLEECRRRANREEIKVKKVIHAEVTPDEHFFGADGRFLPIENNMTRCGFGSPAPNQKCLNCITGWDCKSELESANGEGAEACVYGVYAYDHGSHSASNHRVFCQSIDIGHDQPEIHPFDAIWWEHPDRKGWMFGVFQDDSNRYSFPHCGSSNGNEWSQAPRDLTFRFPFKFPRRDTAQQACLRHVRTRDLPRNAANIVRPLNVSTGEFVNPSTEAAVLTIGGRDLLRVVKEVKTERETHVRVEGRIVGNDVVGEIILRVAVGCNARAGGNCGRGANTRDSSPVTFDRLHRANPLVTYDKSDLGAGYYYAELTFECACPVR
jgi:hypothetical protein